MAVVPLTKTIRYPRITRCYRAVLAKKQTKQNKKTSILPQARAVSFVVLPQGLHLVQLRLLCP